jgi:ElaB/YqjD/DUF883 family membrane-anchored ribosome-binding protein
MRSETNMTTRTESTTPGEGVTGKPGQETKQRVTENVARAAHDAVDRAAGPAGRAEERVRRMASEGEERLRERGGEARETTEQAMEQVRRYVRENPLAAAGIAFVAGVCVSRLLSR